MPQTPAAVHAALAGDAGPLLRLQVLAASRVEPRQSESGELDEALFLATSCEETPFPWGRTAPPERERWKWKPPSTRCRRRTSIPSSPKRAARSDDPVTCIGWPDAASAPPAAAALPNVPTLILSGGQDLRTRPKTRERSPQLIPDAQILVVPYTGHSVIGSDLTNCAQAALVAFFARHSRSAHALRLRTFSPRSRAAASTAAWRPAHGVGGTPGRTLTATRGLDPRSRANDRASLGISFGELPVGARFGGLRGGDARVTKTSRDPRIATPTSPASSSAARSRPTCCSKPRDRLPRSRSQDRRPLAGSVRLSAAHRFSGVLGGTASRCTLARSPPTPTGAASKSNGPRCCHRCPPSHDCVDATRSQPRPRRTCASTPRTPSTGCPGVQSRSRARASRTSRCSSRSATPPAIGAM